MAKIAEKKGEDNMTQLEQAKSVALDMFPNQVERSLVDSFLELLAEKKIITGE